MSPRFYDVFWTLSLYDIYLPLDRYQAEIGKLTSAAQATNLEERGIDHLTLVKRKREKERMLSLASKLESEMKCQKEKQETIAALLLHEKNEWFIQCS